MTNPTETLPGQLTDLLTLREIAAWQLDEAPAQQGTIMADLPALQRGAVWKVKQIEDLWDSVLRGFPIGSFILSPSNKATAALLRQDFKLQRTRSRTPTHILLDGQQRATAIALAFDDIWLHQYDEATAALWVDLAEPPPSRQVIYAFRVLTRSHPWGYQLDDPGKILKSSDIRDALRTWRQTHNARDKRPTEFKLREVWPWDCIAPVPVAPMISALYEHPNDLDAVRAALRRRIERLSLPPNITALLDDAKHQKRLTLLLQRLRGVLLGPSIYKLPPLMLHLDQGFQDTSPETENAQRAQDAIQLLFTRINSAGTPLAGEELAYSLLKAEWPEIAQWMQELKNKPAVPSRVAALCIRLVIARNERQTTLPPMPDMPGLRRLLHDNGFKQKLQDFIRNDAENLFGKSWEFLTGPGFALLPVQAVDMAQHAPDVYLLFLRWLDRLIGTNLSLNDLTPTQHQRTLGFLTALAWFAPDKNRACAAIWPDLEKEVDTEKLKNRFNATRFRAACQLSNRGELRMIPLPSPDDLDAVCRRFIDKDGRTKQAKEKNTVHDPKGTFWNDNDWWYAQFVPALAHSLQKTWQSGLGRRDASESDEYEPLDHTALVEQIAGHFLDTLHAAKPSVLLYAQRKALKAWFPEFDPSQPDTMEDYNRPWDWDHLLAKTYLRGKATSVKEWGDSIGNFRAWPLEANRSDGDGIPKIKLSDKPSEEEDRYGIGEGKKMRQASFVDDALDWPHWQQAVPTDNEDNVSSKGYLGDDNSYRVHTVTAMVKRFVALYRHWYDELRINNLTA